MQRLEVSGAVRPLRWPLGVKWLNSTVNHTLQTGTRRSVGMTPLILNCEISRPGRATHSAGRWVGPTADIDV
jgi:hypothetical protein